MFLRSYVRCLAIVVVLSTGRGQADDIQIIEGSWSWPDQGVGCIDPNGDTDKCGIVRDLLNYHGKLLVAGEFLYAGGTDIVSLAVWDGSSWSGLGGEGTDLPVQELIAVGEDLYIGGNFSSIGGVPARSVARWDGFMWWALDDGVNGIVYSLAWWDDGSGPALFVAGSFGNAGGADGVAASRIAKWDGKKWSALGSGCSSVVRAVAVFDDGTGPALYAGGFFDTAGGKVVNKIAKWDGKEWHALGKGITSVGYVEALCAFDDGSGPALYVAGDFDEVNGELKISNIARWDGKNWSAVGTRPPFTFDLEVLDAGDGPALYAGANKWDGKMWTKYVPVYGAVTSVEVFDGPDGPTLHVAGAIALEDHPFSLRPNIVRWDGPTSGGPTCGDFDGNGHVDQADLGILLAAFNCSGGKGCAGDADGDGDTDQSDLGILLKHFGQKCG